MRGAKRGGGHVGWEWLVVSRRYRADYPVPWYLPVGELTMSIELDFAFHLARGSLHERTSRTRGDWIRTCRRHSPDGLRRLPRLHGHRGRGLHLYAHVVGEVVKKIGTTSPRPKDRVAQNAGTINQVIALSQGRARSDARWHHRPFDAFKRLAPDVIRANQSIEIWAVQSTQTEYKVLERELNARFDTLRNGWTTLLG